jgi:hypothetical protein
MTRLLLMLVSGGRRTFDALTRILQSEIKFPASCSRPALSGRGLRPWIRNEGTATERRGYNGLSPVHFGCVPC